jgi:hypothetical protein
MQSANDLSHPDAVRIAGTAGAVVCPVKPRILISRNAWEAVIIDYQFDRRDIPDNIQMIYEYPKKQMLLILMYI